MEKLNRREALQKGGRMVVSAAACMALPPFLTGCSNEAEAIAAGKVLGKKLTPVDIQKLKITIVYDNNRFKKELKTDWGFSCLIEGLDQTILFDTGRYDTILMANLNALDIDPKKIDLVFLSHEHPDHIGGLEKILASTSRIDILMAQSFLSGIGKEAKTRGSKEVRVNQPVMVTKSGLSSGEMKSFVKNEQALFIDTTGGVIVITGCAHPGIVDIIERSQKLLQKDILLVLGGFHLLQDHAGSIREIASRFQEMNVRYVAPTHCSGPETRTIFKEMYGENYLDSGVGRIITARDMPGRAV